MDASITGGTAPMPAGAGRTEGCPPAGKEGAECKAAVSAQLSFVPCFNLALQQNAFPVIHELKLKNCSSRRLENVECLFSATPAFFAPKTVTAEGLEPGEERPLHDLGIELDYAMLSSLSEAARGKMHLEVRSGEELLFSGEYDVEAFAPDQWLGLGVMPELLASFVTPNLDSVNLLMGVVADELEKATGSSAIQGYQADRKRVYEICSAIYRAVLSWGIRYSNPPSSFGTPGQRIRFADTVYRQRLGTCLDTTVLFASVMEQCGLHPVILLQNGHAYIGCHLVERYFSDVPMDDLQTIRKLADLDEFLVVETTMATQNRTFSVAEAAARAEHLNIDGDFQCAIDIVRARYSGIRPLPLKYGATGIEFRPPERRAEDPGEECGRHLETEIDLSRLENHEERSGRVARWSQKLLDLSLRNRLLNVRDTKQVIPVVCSDITLLEDKIAADEMLSLHPLDRLLSEKDQHDLAMLRNSEVKNEIKALLDRELEQRRLWTPLAPQEALRRLTGLYRQSRTDLEEGGVNTLFLAVGFLEWKVSEREEKSCLAPILLIPVRLQRRSMEEGIRISRIDEDTVINETLLELLRSQFQLAIPGLAPLPTDESGVDVKLVMRIFRQAIRDRKGWEVREEARIGHFSFAKFIMWNDLTTRVEALKRNPLVGHLIEGGGVYDDGIEVFPAEEIGKHLNLKELCCPMSADSSQLAAVLYSQTGKSFVLHGPPGTGKSQTITNIIAHNLALGRRVLFVSEKKAALDVVHRRLSAVGLRPFCLELHSSKAGKTEVLAQFSEALRVPDSPASGEWDSTVETLDRLRGELNEYVAELHRVFPNGLSAYTCFARLFRKKNILPEGSLNVDCLNQSRADFETLERLAADLENAWDVTSPEAVAAMRVLAPADWGPVYEKEMLAAAEAFRNAAERLDEAFTDQARQLELPDRRDLETIYRTASLAEHLKNCGSIPPGLLSEEEFESHAAFLKRYGGNALWEKMLREKLRNYRLELLRDLDFAGIAARIEQNNQAFFLIRFLKNRTLLKELSGLKKTGGSPLSIRELTALLPDFETYAAAAAEVGEGMGRAEKLLGRLWNAGEPDWNALDSILERTREILNLAGELTDAGSPSEMRLLEKLRTLLEDGARIFAKDSPARLKINSLLQSWNDFQEIQQKFSEYAAGFNGENTLPEMADAARKILECRRELRSAMRYCKLRKNAADQGLCALAEALESGLPQNGRLSEAFSTAYHAEMLNRILAQSPVLCDFTGLNHEERIRKFREMDAKYTDLAKRTVFARLASALPRRRSGPCPEGTELGILKRECEKRARQKPVRRLLELIPSLAPVLKPCFLMSPLSVAQYLPPDTAQFDLIVFDEASQIPVWDAIGVIARGRQLIVVGDPRQMPPTSFFQKGENDGDEIPEGDAEDLESILDECIAAGVHPTYLNWHYRSRHESLISFSNHYYYGDRLFTFPAARDSERLGIRFEFVPDGVYDRRGSRTNLREAEALVRYVFARLENPELKPRTIGIITFSQAQKELIEDLMEEERVRHPRLESCFSDRNEEGLFIKNLENVQGDERDVILFSIGYAPDAEGKFSMNFGPLNRQGGERRLNVAITRAREQIVVFSSIHAHQIDLARTGAVGAAHLKYFLDYAEKGFRIQSKNTSAEPAEGLADVIAGFLNANGFAVERNVGCSDCRIDIAVRNPDRPSEYLLGIECDGKVYASQKTARDRDSLRAGVLQTLGWHIFHAWSVDWAFDRKRSEQALLELLEKIRTAPPEPAPPPAPEPAEESPQQETFEKTSPSPAVPEHRAEYRAWINDETLDQEAFYEPGSRELIRRQIREIIRTEGPVCESLLKKRIVRAWGFTRTGDNILSVLHSAMPREFEVTELGHDRVFWPEGLSPSAYHDYRVSPEGKNRRSLEEIPPEELANAMYEVLVDFHSCEPDTLYRETVKLFGFSAVTAKARKYLDAGFQALKQSGRI